MINANLNNGNYCIELTAFLFDAESRRMQYNSLSYSQPNDNMANSPIPYNQWVTYKRLMAYLRPYWWIALVTVLANALYSAVDAGMVKMLQPLIDNVFVAKDHNYIKWVPIIIPAAFLLRGVMSFVSDYGMAYIARHLIATIRQQVFQHLQRLPARYYDNTPCGQILSTLSYNVDQVAKASTNVVIDVIRNSFLTVFLLAVMFHTNWLMTLMFLTIGPIVVVIFTQASKRFRQISHRIQKNMGNVTQVAQENVDGYRVVRIFNGEQHEINKFKEVTEHNRHLEMKMIVTSAVSSPLIQLLGGVGLALTIYYAISPSGGQQLSAGEFAALMTAIVSLLNPIKQLTSISSKIQQGLAGAQSVFALLDLPPEPDRGKKALHKVQGSLSFKEVGFAYLPERPVLQNINLTIAAGETVAIVGRSGSGKSTLTSLLPRFYDDYQGDIFIDDVNTREVPLKDLRAQLAMVSQHVVLFNDTIAHNIAYGHDNMDRAAVENAAKLAYATGFITSLPQGFDTIIGENGVLLSGGQRQRLAIARAIYKNAPILILDEATSALDSESERYIQSALQSLMKNKTTLVIAHRLSTIEHADNIVVIEDGRIIEMGKHAQLLAKNGAYSQFHALQLQQVN